MIIKKEIMEIVKEKEKRKSDLVRCVESGICPKCGSFLKRTAALSDSFEEHVCSSERCDFKYIE